MMLLLLACGNEHAIIDTSNDTQPVIELSCPQPEINLSCPEVVCPEPIVRDIVIEALCPDVYVDQPDVNLTVEGPDMSGIESAIDDMTLAIEDAIISGVSSSTGHNNFFAHVFQCTSNNWNTPHVLFTNNTNSTAIITSVITNEENVIVNINNVPIPGRWTSIYYSHPGANGHPVMPAKTGKMTFPLEPGESISCNVGGSYSSSSDKVFFQGYYQN